MPLVPLTVECLRDDEEEEEVVEEEEAVSPRRKALKAPTDGYLVKSSAEMSLSS